MAKLSTVGIFLIAIAAIAVVALAIGAVIFALQRRLRRRKSQVMITMGGMTVINDNGSRKVMEAAWAPTYHKRFSLPPGTERSSIDTNPRSNGMGTPPIGAGLVQGKEDLSTVDIESMASEIEPSGSPAPRTPNGHRTSYISARRLNIPSVLAEHLNEEDEDSSLNGPARSGSSGGSLSISTVADEKIVPVYIESSQCGSSTTIENDLAEIPKVSDIEKEVIAAMNITAQSRIVAA